MTDTLERMTHFYETLENLPIDYPEDFSLLYRTSSPEKNSFYITTRDEHNKRMKGRFHLWDNVILKLLKKFEYNFPDCKVTNRFYRSRLSIYDKATGTELKIWSPKGDLLFSNFIKNRFKGRIKKKKSFVERSY